MNKFPVMRNEQSKSGLKAMIEYINRITPTKYMDMVEVGAYEGDGTLIFNKYFNSVIAVDMWKSGIGDITNRVDMAVIYNRFRKNIDGTDIDHYRADSVEVADSMVDKVAMVYIDAGHTYDEVKRDILAWKDNVLSGGWICGHDYRAKFPGVITAVNELLGKPLKVFPDTSWIVRA